MSGDPMASIGAVKSLATSLSDLGAQLANAAPTGAFGAVLSQVNAEMAALSGGGTEVTAASDGNLSGASPVDSLIGSGPDSSYGTAAQRVSAAAVGTSDSAAGVADSGGSTASLPVSGQAVVADAEKYLGVRYQWGGTSPATGLDCSGLVQRVYSDLGISLPRTSEEQATVGMPVASVAQARPGDLVFYEPSASGPGHVGIYIGNGQMINAPHTGTVVRVDSVGTPSAIRRILPAVSSPATVMVASAYAPAPTAATSLPVATMWSPGMNRLGVPASLQPLFAAAGSRYGIDPLLLASVAKQESGFRTTAVSGAGAQGLMQLMPATAVGLGVSPFDPASAIDGAAQLLSGYLHDYGGSVPMALAAYNAGPGAVAASQGVPAYPETENYVSNITSMLAGAQAAGGTGAVQ